MSQNGKSRTVTVRIQRFNPDEDKKPHMQEYQMEMTPDTTVLDALHEIKTQQDGSIT